MADFVALLVMCVLLPVAGATMLKMWQTRPPPPAHRPGRGSDPAGAASPRPNGRAPRRRCSMTTDNKTLADVQPGGRVKLVDLAERARFEGWARAQSYRGGNILTDRDADHPNMYADPLGQLTWKCWRAALSAQPSPGGPGDALVTDAMVMAALQATTRETLAGVSDCESKVIGVLTAYGIDGAVDIPTMVRAMLEAALAARHPRHGSSFEN